MGSRLFLRRFPLFLKLLKGFCVKPPILEAFPPFFLSPSMGVMGRRLFLRRFPLFPKLAKEIYEKPPIIEAFPPFF